MPKIAGGERVGHNLFHTLEEFSIPEGTEATFENTPDIENIFILITGDDISVIDGLIQTSGDANFFLINSNGIVFGKNTRLDVGGSFIATTANSIEFANDTIWAIGDGNLSPATPKKLNFNGGNGNITVNGTENQIINKSWLAPIEFGQKPLGLEVKNGQTLSLIGNGLHFNGGVATTEDSKIDLTSIESGSVEINYSDNGLTLIGNRVTAYQDINLEEKSLIKSSESISLKGKNINITNGSFVLGYNQDNSPHGSIEINASETLTLSGCSESPKIPSAIRSETLNTGKGATINVSAQELVVQESGRIRTYSFSDGLGGDINVNISGSSHFSKGSIIATTYGKGDAGNINVSTSQLNLNLAGITSSTFGDGNGGMVDIDADLIEIAGNNSLDRGSIAATSFGSGNTGNVTINTSQLRIIEGASLSSSSFSFGNAGDLTIKATKSIEIIGEGDNPKAGKNPQSTIRSAVQTVSPGGRKAFNLPDVPTGDAGNLIINTPILKVAQAGIITVANQGTGKAGTIKLTSDRLTLEEGGSITAAAESGEGGDIVLSTQNLEIGKNSKITAGDKDAGKITISTNYLTSI